MTPYIEAKKAEAREMIRERFSNMHGEYVPPKKENLYKLFDHFADTLLDEIQEAVSLEKETGDDFYDEAANMNDNFDNGYNLGWNSALKWTKQRFQHLRTGVETE